MSDPSDLSRPPRVSYVMVPVPSDHVLDLLRWLQFRTEPEEHREDDLDRLTQVVQDADETTRTLLVLVAKATIEGDPVRLSDAADMVDQGADAVRAMLTDAGRRSLGEGRTLVKVLNEIGVNEHGRRGRFAYLIMRPHHARAVRAAGQHGRRPPLEGGAR